MPAAHPFGSLASLGTRLGPLTEGHLLATFRRIMGGPEVTFAPGYVRLLTGEPHPFANFTLLANGHDLSAAEEAIAPLTTCGAPAAVLTTGAASEAMSARLQAAGFFRHGGLPAMAVAIDALAPTQLPAGYTFRRYCGAQHIGSWSDAFARGYELPPKVGQQFAAGLDGDPADAAPLQYFGIERGGEIVCTSMVHCLDGVAGIYGVATLPEERKRGLGAHATAEALRRVRPLGYRVGVLQASEAGHPVYLRLGFTDVGDVPLFVRIPS